MRKFLPAFIWLLLPFATFSQQSAAKWQAAFQPQKVFIENKSQFDGLDDMSDKILFGTESGSTMFLFNKHGITYRLEKLKMREEDENELITHDEHVFGAAKSGSDRDGNKKEVEGLTGLAAVHMQWEGANEDVQIVAERRGIKLLQLSGACQKY